MRTPDEGTAVLPHPTGNGGSHGRTVGIPHAPVTSSCPGGTPVFVTA